MNIRTIKLVGLATVTVALISCGGGSGNFAGIDRLSVTGPVSGFGSVIVNGVEWRTNAATVTIDGQPGSEAGLEVGQIVTITGRPDVDGKGGQAESVSLQNNVQGIVLSVDPGTSSFVILGQTIIVNVDTSTDPLLPGDGIAGITVGDSLAVSGFVDSAGNIHATRVQKVPASATQRVLGKVSTVNVALRTLTIGGLTAGYSGALLVGFTGSDPAAGDLVLASGSVDSGQQLVATEIDFRPQTAPGAAGEDGEVEGLVSVLTSASDFQVDGVRVLTNGATQFENGTATDIRLNAKIEVEGQIDPSGRIIARKISIKAATTAQQIEIVQNVSSIDTAANTLTIFGVTVQLDSETRLEDKSLAEKRPFSLSDISAGDQLLIRGVAQLNAAARVLATRVDRQDVNPGSIVLQGPVDVVNGTNGVNVLGASVVTDNLTQFLDSTGTARTATEFFALVQPGTVVRASFVNGNTGTASQLRIIPASSDE